MDPVNDNAVEGPDRRRRALLAGGLAALVTVVLPPGRVRAAAPATSYLGCHADGDGGHRVAAFDGAGRLLFSSPLPGRGHGIAVRPGGDECVVVARRPGRFLRVLDLADGRLRHGVDAPAGRHCQGHGVYGTDGRLLYVCENDYEAGRGVIGVYDATAGYRRVGELPSHGVGPHELRLLADGRTLAVANGGILTHPDYGRAKLNLDSMAPSLALVDVGDGRLLADHRLPRELHQLSIRHLDVRGDGTVAIAMQHQGAPSERVPLVGLARPGKGITLLEAPPEVTGRMRNYCGSVAFDVAGEHFAVSSPRGGLTTLWSAAGDYLGHVDLADGCGVAPSGAGGFVLSSGGGRVLRISDGRALADHRFAATRWDNHLTALGQEA